MLHRPKPLACEPDSGEEWVSPASPDEAPQAKRRSSPNGLNDMEMEVANELRALQRGVPSTTGRHPSTSRPLSELPVSRVGSDQKRLTYNMACVMWLRQN